MSLGSQAMLALARLYFAVAVFWVPVVWPLNPASRLTEAIRLAPNPRDGPSPTPAHPAPLATGRKTLL